MSSPVVQQPESRWISYVVIAVLAILLARLGDQSFSDYHEKKALQDSLAHQVRRAMRFDSLLTVAQRTSALHDSVAARRLAEARQGQSATADTVTRFLGHPEAPDTCRQVVLHFGSLWAAHLKADTVERLFTDRQTALLKGQLVQRDSLIDVARSERDEAQASLREAISAIHPSRFWLGAALGAAGAILIAHEIR